MDTHERSDGPVRVACRLHFVRARRPDARCRCASLPEVVAPGCPDGPARRRDRRRTFALSWRCSARPGRKRRRSSARSNGCGTSTRRCSGSRRCIHRGSDSRSRDRPTPSCSCSPTRSSKRLRDRRTRGADDTGSQAARGAPPAKDACLCARVLRAGSDRCGAASCPSSSNRHSNPPSRGLRPTTARKAMLSHHRGTVRVYGV